MRKIKSDEKNRICIVVREDEKFVGVLDGMRCPNSRGQQMGYRAPSF